ncbi:dead-box atp-dependent rna helicase 42 [Quercus suber]|uniref:Dead-box atp-dependent rna helicase 42 n=1 Tax=Quercus suber TaxID=58331 RepID=A0AAW0LBQ2_QUESU
MDESKHKERDRENKKREREREEKQHGRGDDNDENNPKMIPIRKENNVTREDAELKDEEEQRRLGEEIQKRRRRAQELLEYFMRKNEEAKLAMNCGYGVEELEINDFPQNARWRLTRKETLAPISEWTGAAISTRGQYFAPGRIPGPGERKLYLFIEGPNEQSVKRAKSELKRVLEDIMKQALQSASHPGRYQVL